MKELLERFEREMSTFSVSVHSEGERLGRSGQTPGSAVQVYRGVGQVRAGSELFVQLEPDSCYSLWLLVGGRQGYLTAREKNGTDLDNEVVKRQIKPTHL